MARTWIAVVASFVFATSAVAQTSARPTPADQHDHQHGAAGQLGRVHFETSCAPAVAAEFDRGLALLHSFWFSAAIDAFTKVLAADPNCGMAHWGIAMSWWSNPFGTTRSPQALKAGLAATDAAKALPGGTPRERAYLAAVDVLYRDAATRDQRSRVVAYEQAMGALADAYPKDVEARIFYALALAQSALPTDKTYANQLKAASNPRRGIREAAGASRAGALHHPQLEASARWPRAASAPRAATPRSHPTRRTRSTCRRTRSRVSACRS